MNFHLSLRHRLSIALVALLIPLTSAYAFSDSEARKAILELRQRVEAQRQVMDQQANSILDLSSQIQELRSEIAVLRGRLEKIERTATQIASQTAPREMTVDGKTFTATPQEIADYEVGLERLRAGDYAAAVNVFQSFIMRWSNSGYKDSAYFWLGNAQYGNKQYREAIQSFSMLTDSSPGHARTPDAMLSVANCYLALNNTSSMRATLERILKDYPDSEAATQARSRLGRM
ncbi:MAG: tol-pal system protein YbgF [Saezia sp.]